MKYVTKYKCVSCGKEYGKNQSIYTCKYCGGILDVLYDYETLKNKLDFNYFNNNKNYTIWRYINLLTVCDKEINNTLNVGFTPLYKANKLSEIIGVENLYIKDEGLNPTGSLKDRASAVGVLKAIEEGKKIISCSSTGNAASSLAGNAARLGLKTVIFVPERAPTGKIAQLLLYGAKVFKVKGDYKDTFELSKKAINHYGWYNRNAAINPHLVEGKKTVSFEISEQLKFIVPDWVAVSVGDGCTIAGVHKGFYDFYKVGLINKIPKLLGVQAAGCSPFYNAYINNEELKETDENTIADSISVGMPRNIIKAQNAVENSNGTWITVTDEEILDAMSMLGKSEGIFGEPAGVASLAGVKNAVLNGIIKKDETVCVIMTGNGLKDIENALKAVKMPVTLKPNIEDLKGYLKGENL